MLFVQNDERGLEQWLADGGFPRTAHIEEASAKDDYVQNVVEHILEKDIRARKKTRNRIAFDRSMAYAVNNFDATTNPTNIVGYLDNVEGSR